MAFLYPCGLLLSSTYLFNRYLLSANSLPGIVLEVRVKAGDIVKEGQVIAVIEAMKMENEISMEQGGVVTAVHVAAGEFIPQGKSIITIV